MGDISLGDRCDRFIKEFNEDAVRLFGLKLGKEVGIEQGLETNMGWMDVYFYAELSHKKQTWTVMLPEVLFSPDWDEEDLINNTMNNFELEEDEARAKLVKSGLLKASEYAVGAFRKFKTDYVAMEAQYNGKRCKIIEVVPGDADPSVDNYRVEFDDGHKYLAFLSEVPEAWVDTVKCKLCHKEVPAKTAHLHQGEYICDEWCWDDRLKSTE